MAWWYLYEDASGRLVSESSEEPNIGRGFSTLELPDRADLRTTMWDETSRSFVPRPTKVLVDRVDDIVSDARLNAAIGRLTQAQLDAVKAVVGEVLGSERFRNETADVVIR